MPTRACVIVYGFGYVRRRRRPDIVDGVYCIAVSYTHLIFGVILAEEEAGDDDDDDNCYFVMFLCLVLC